MRSPPSTRYQGSKLKLASWIWEELKDIPFDSALDAFGGTGTVSYLLKAQGKQVHYNDYLRFNAETGRALIENAGERLEEKTIESLMASAAQGSSDGSVGFIQRTFRDIYYTDEENAWLDRLLPAIAQIKSVHQRALAWHSLFQACIAKRPYNLFHRKNLYVRTAAVERSFGNKVTWDTPFEAHFRRFAAEANEAVFDNGRRNRVSCQDAASLSGDFDLVYLDPPYTSAQGVSVDYQQFYHFLEGMVRAEEWEGLLDQGSRHLRLQPLDNAWNDKKRVGEAFSRLFARFRDSALVVSYRSEGIPSIGEIRERMLEVKKDVRIATRENYRYVLSKASNAEVLVIGT